MESIKTIESTVMPILRNNIDTDVIMPKQYLKSTKKTGYEGYLFDPWRYLDSAEWGDDCSKREHNPDFVLNDIDYNDSQILLVKENFGCGSSREHAVWGLKDYGFKVILGLSFASIFHNNAIRNGLLLVTITQKKHDSIVEEISVNKKSLMTINLEKQNILINSINIDFSINNDEKQRFLQGLDDIDITSKHLDKIIEFENKKKTEEPWIFNELC
ncbi:MAG: 3-isopropylmalate dehydratase small subunit [Francisellaceae bacterium]|jgi:3-isopropylmalate/(R)-2-methylmalate dehydratase small subunit|nr:3-isopropylmalate dehydratase small subunit [Francisellaceae bacterium]MBT6208021.1 3-isopropylmalate dehydratase small subunit [Francisellaceae bacterium]MBT6539686.1 3-isopropylmalate dehydratase small subunit [Francisellaceae bacterium]